jgi:hypothetical protein
MIDAVATIISSAHRTAVSMPLARRTALSTGMTMAGPTKAHKPLAQYVSFRISQAALTRNASASSNRHFNAGQRAIELADQELELGRLGDWQLSRLRAVQDLASIDAGLTKTVRNIGTVAHQAADFDKAALGISRGNPISCCQGGKLHTTAAEEGVGGQLAIAVPKAKACWPME